MYKVACKHITEPGGSPLKWDDQSVNNLVDELFKLLKLLDYSEGTIRNASILIHPNLVRPSSRRPASFTDPRLIVALVRVLKELGAGAIEIGENPGFQYASRSAFSESGLTDALSREEARILCFDEEEWVQVDNPKGRLYRRIKVAKSVLDTDLLINVPKLKTHMLTGVSLCIKNLLGMIHDDQRQIFHRNDIADKVVDLHFVRSPDLNIVDGLWAMEGQAPFDGDTIQSFNYLLAGKEAAVVDAVTCRLMGLNQAEVPHVQLACKRLLEDWEGLGSVQILGDDPALNRRVFKRPILSSMAQFQGIDCIECGVCRGCLSAVRHSLDWLDGEGKLKDCPQITVVSGRSMPNMSSLETWEGQLILFGNCAAEFLFYDPERRKDAIFLPGCAPHVLDLANLLKEKFNL